LKIARGKKRIPVFRYPLDLTISFGFSGSAMYPPDPHRITNPKIPSEFSYREYDGDPNDTSGIQRIQRIPWESRKSRGYGGDPENPGDTVEIQRIQRIRPGSKGYGILSICNVS
jgi:hypothetical protein